ncbi:MAG: DsbA family oxidoreductase [Gammaproteobacteria bacterium]|nr:DsbA family oxidoreductase [Gammaproteobacteria bacterium]MCP5198752.1 DsbA family oxidoreductase [Gammaproteobacteria bacterium]
MATAATPPYAARLDIVSDVVCPWCYIGKRRLEQALATLDGELALEVHWQPYELNPTLPAEGMDRRAYCEAKFGSLEYARQLYENVAANARADGLPMAIERIARTPNTRRAHRLLELAGAAGCQDAVVDALFQAYFVDGRDVGDVDTLLGIASAAGMDAGRVREALDDAAALARIEQEERSAQAMGINGVPAFLFNGRLLFTGAQTPETIALALKRAAAKGL